MLCQRNSCHLWFRYIIPSHTKIWVRIVFYICFSFSFKFFRLNLQSYGGTSWRPQRKEVVVLVKVLTLQKVEMPGLGWLVSHRLGNQLCLISWLGLSLRCCICLFSCTQDDGTSSDGCVFCSSFSLSLVLSLSCMHMHPHCPTACTCFISHANSYKCHLANQELQRQRERGVGGWRLAIF